jgi:hypothetical protein
MIDAITTIIVIRISNPNASDTLLINSRTCSCMISRAAFGVDGEAGVEEAGEGTRL